MSLFTLGDLEQAADLVRRRMAPTPQYAWPQLCAVTGATVWVKHENHGPTGAFKARGAVTFIDWLRRVHPEVSGLITATRGNHGQAQAWAAAQAGLRVMIVVPEGNSPEKNAAMRAFGATVLSYGHDFDDARQEAVRLAQADGLFMVPAFHRELVRGVATAGLELLTAVPDLDTVYVPVGCGSGLCGMIAARDALNRKTRIVGVVAERAPAAKLSFEAGRLITTPTAATFADGLAVRIPVEAAFAIYAQGADRIVTVSDEDIAEAMRLYYRHSHTLAEGAGAAALAALIAERGRMAGLSVGVVLSGANVDLPVLPRF